MQRARTEGRTHSGVMSIRVGSIGSTIIQPNQLTLIVQKCAVHAEHDKDSIYMQSYGQVVVIMIGTVTYLSAQILHTRHALHQE